MSSALRSFCFAFAVAFAAFGAPATDLELTAPDSVNLNQPFQITVKAIDGNGAVDPSYTGTVEFASSPNFTMPPDSTFTPADQGVRTFTVTPTRGGYGTISVQDVANSSFFDNHSMTIACPGFTLELSYDRPACADVAPTLRAVTSDPDAMVSWLGPSKWFGSGRTVAGKPNYTGTYFVEAYNPMNGCKVEASIFVTVEEPPIATGLPPSTCGPTRNTVTLQNGPFSNIVWEVEGGTIVGGQGTNAVTLDAPDQPVAGGEFRIVRVYMSGTSADGCVYTRRQVETMAVYGAYNLPISSPDTACPGAPQNASASAPAGGTYQWSITNGTITSASGGNVTYELNGAADAVLSVSWSSGTQCASGQKTIAVDDSPSHVTINTPPSACPGVEQTASVHGNPAGSYQWSITNGTITQNNGNNIRYTVSGNATLNVSIDSTSGCDAAGQASIAATGPTATIPTRDDDICAGETYAIPVALSGAAPFTVTWSDGHVDSNITATSYSRVVSPEVSTTYRITAVQDANCSGNVSGDVGLVVSGAAPEVTDQPDDTTVARGSSATLTIAFTPPGASVQWYRGARGDRSNPVQGATSATLHTPRMESTERFWALVRNNCGSVATSSATVQVTGAKTPKRRSVRH